MPPVSKITISHPEWVKDAPSVQEQVIFFYRIKHSLRYLINYLSLQEKHEPYYETQSGYHHHVEHQRQEEHHQEPHHEEPHHEEPHHGESYQEQNEGNDDHNYHEEHHEENHEEHEEHYVEQNNNQEEHHQKEIKTYSMIEWDPAYQDPPNTGSLGADIPDLSSFKNVWDQSHIQQQNHIWVAPVHQPEPQIMTKPEYSNYNTDDYDSEHLYPRERYHEVERHQANDHQHEEYHEEYHHEEEHHEEKYHEEKHLEEQQHEEQHHEYNHHRPGVVYPPCFPWDSIPNHFPAPTRVWQPAHQQQQWPEERRCKFIFVCMSHRFLLYFFW